MYRVLLSKRDGYAYAKTPHEAAQKMRAFIQERCLGSSEWTGGALYKSTSFGPRGVANPRDWAVAGRVSYNGRVWDVNNVELL